MNRSSLHGAPPRGTPLLGSQLSKSQPAAIGTQKANENTVPTPSAPMTLRLKKKAVKIIGPAAPGQDALPRSSPAPAPELPKIESSKPADLENTQPATTPRSPVPSAPTAVTVTALDNGHDALEEMFARLTNKAPANSLTAAAPVPKAAFDEKAKKMLQAAVFKSEEPIIEVTSPSLVVEEEEVKDGKVNKTSASPESLLTEESKDTRHDDLDQQYLLKAADYLRALPLGKNIPIQLVKTIAAELHDSYKIPEVELGMATTEKLKSRYAFAVVQYVNRSLKKGTSPLTTDHVKSILHKVHGDFLSLCATLVEQKYLALDNMDEVYGLCKTIMDILPKSGSVVREGIPTSGTSKSLKTLSNPLQAWPMQEKREAPATYRACILKGVPTGTTINQLQAIVWGGRLESVAMPVSGLAVVKFLTPEACDAYFKATANGLELPGPKKAVIFVEKQPGPSSINDVIRNCTESDASRCVRAIDAEKDWSDMMLTTIARGKGAAKREVDCVKRGQLANGRYFIEFRFASIYHALQFKRELDNEPDWDHCTITYAADPCETACGVHSQDADKS